MSIRVFRADGDQRPPPRKGQTAPWGREPGIDRGSESRPARPPGPPRGGAGQRADRPPFQPRGDRAEPRRDTGFAPRREGGFAPKREGGFAPRRPDVVPPPASPAALQALAALQATMGRDPRADSANDRPREDRPRDDRRSDGRRSDDRRGGGARGDRSPEQARFAPRSGAGPNAQFAREGRVGGDRADFGERRDFRERRVDPRERSEPPRRLASDAAPRVRFDELEPKVPGGQRLNKRMAALGLASRREADEWIERGYVKVNGEVARVGQQVVDADKIEIEPAALEQQSGLVTFIINKPVGYVSAQAEDGHPPAIQLLTPESMDKRGDGKQPFRSWHLQRLAPAGRLDIDSTGLLVLTQDGRVARSIIGEDSDMEKEYLVRVEYQGAPDMGVRNEADDIAPTEGGELNAQAAIKKNVKSVFPSEMLEKLRFGIMLDGEELLPAKVSWQNEEQLRFVLREGKKRQIRRMCELVGLKVVGLKRIRIGSISLGDLPPGKWRYLMPFEKF